ncbi:MAG: TatD family hydrolase, partial [Gaiellaceae bacterium]
MIDTHAHLDALDEDPEDVLARARDAGVTRVLTVGTAEAVALADRFDEVFAIVGIHPHEAASGDVDE